MAGGQGEPGGALGEAALTPYLFRTSGETPSACCSVVVSLPA